MSDKPFRTGKSAAKRAARRQEAMIAEQKQAAELERAEAEDAVARRKALGRRGGRSLLLNPGMATGGRSSTEQAPTPRTTNLGGNV